MQNHRLHYPEYWMEALGLGLFMISASVVTVILEHPASWVHQAIPDAVLRRLIIGISMGLTAIGLIYSPWGQQSGAHLNPVVTLTFFRLGKVKFKDACGYIVAQFIGGLLGMVIATRILGAAIAHRSVAYVVTIPGDGGAVTAFWAELFIFLWHDDDGFACIKSAKTSQNDWIICRCVNCDLHHLGRDRKSVV